MFRDFRKYVNIEKHEQNKYIWKKESKEGKIRHNDKHHATNCYIGVILQYSITHP